MSTVKYSWRTLVALFGALVLILGMAVSPASAVPLDEVSSSSGDIALTPESDVTPQADNPEVVTPELNQPDEAPERIGDSTGPTAVPQPVEATSPAADPLARVTPMTISVGSISGHVSVPAGVNPQSVSVYAYTDIDSPHSSVAVAANGSYVMGDLPVGQYKIWFGSSDETISSQWWNNAVDFYSAAWVDVTAGQVATNIDATLLDGGSISGVVTVPSDVNVLNSYVSVYDAANEWVTTTGVNSDGSFTLTSLVTGTYKVQFRTYGANIAPLWWDGASSFEEATPIEVVAGQDVPNINVTLVKGGSISGTVTLPAGVDPGEVNVAVYDSSRVWMGSSDIAADGSYSIKGLATGSYRVKFEALTGNAATQWWDGVALQRAATYVDVVAGQDTPNINATMPRGGSISGEVTTPAGVDPFSFYVGVFDAAGTQVRYAYLDASGSYTVDGLAAGTYRVKFDSLGAAIAAQWWDGAADIDSATPVEVLDEQDTPNINVDLDSRVPLEGSIPVISGDVTVEGELSANPGSWTPYANLSYQWLANGTPIEGATEPTLTLTAAQYNRAISVRVTGTKAGHTTTSFTSEATEKVAAGTLQSEAPIISGEVRVNNALTLELGEWSPDVSFIYRWYADGVEIEGARSSRFTPKLQHLGQSITATVRGSKSGYTTVTETSAPTAQVAEGVLFSSVPTINGTAKVGNTLSSVRGNWTVDTEFTRQWFADGVAIPGATGISYKLTPAERGKRMTITVTGSKTGFVTQSQTSNATVKVAAGDLSGAIPTINGTPKVGNTLSSVRGNWTVGTTHTRQWFADGVAIPGATGISYKLTAAEAGKRITVTVTGSKTGYATTSRTSVATAKVAQGTLTAPVPTMTGRLQIGWFQTAKPGAWTSGTQFTYQWYADGVAIAGATENAYRLTVNEVGKAITVKVTGSLEGYPTVSKTSAPTDVVPEGELSSSVPIINGTPKVGNTLSSVRGDWSTGTEFTRQWFADGVAIPGATGISYKLTTAEAGKRITVTVTGSKFGYATKSETSVATAKVTQGALTAPVPTITGRLQIGWFQTAKPGAWTSGTEFTYQWYANGAAIAGATEASYRLTVNEVGKAITVKVTGSLEGYPSVSKTSEPTDVVPEGELSSSVPTINGTPKVGNTLSSVRGDWSTGTEFTRQWFADGVAIEGATDISYKLTVAELGKRITVTVTGSKFGYTTKSETSVATAKVTQGELTAPVPTISGNAKIAWYLTAREGTWTSGTEFTYQWFADGVAIEGATERTYFVTVAEAGKQITVRVTGSLEGFPSVSRTSLPTDTVPKRELTTVVPTISGTAVVGSTLNSTRGLWTGGTTFDYQWLADDVAIPGAKDTTYTLTEAEVGKRITVRITGSKLGYETVSQTSDPTMPVVG